MIAVQFERFALMVDGYCLRGDDAAAIRCALQERAELLEALKALLLSIRAVGNSPLQLDIQTQIATSRVVKAEFVGYDPAPPAH